MNRLTAEHARLRSHATGDAGRAEAWRLWGPYTSARQWGTVREDYSAGGDAWDFFPFDDAHRRAYRWGEDGIAGLSDQHGFLHVGVALWNGADDRLKERFFGLTNGQGNHGEDVKEYWWSTDATPSHSYASMLYRYPQAAYPYERLVTENASRSRQDPEFELHDTGVFEENRFFDVEVVHAKAGPRDVCVEVRVTNHGPEAASVHVIPQVWFRNTWSWGRDDRRPTIKAVADSEHAAVRCSHGFLGTYSVTADGEPQVLFCDNETDEAAVFGADTVTSRYPKDGINRAVVHGETGATNPDRVGTKAAFVYHAQDVQPGETRAVRVRLVHDDDRSGDPFAGFADILAERAAEADEFYDQVIPADTSDEDRHVARRAFAGLMWGKQHYRYNVAEWLEGDPAMPKPPASRLAPPPQGRNTEWKHFELADIISMPDDWEYPWFATWDLAFHCVAIAHVDPAFAKEQLLLLCREWSQHPTGQLPAYEWNFSDTNPPVHAWAAWQVYQIDGARDQVFLGTILTKLLLNMGWWVNRKDSNGSNLFEGGFLGLDNISVFDRSHDVPQGWRLEQSDATGWVASAFLVMLKMATELARKDDMWDEIATTFLERFLDIAEAIEDFGSAHVSLWDSADGFFYDALVGEDGSAVPLRVRSLVGFIPMLALADIPQWVRTELTDFTRARTWLEEHRTELIERRLIVHSASDSDGMLALVSPERFERLLVRMLDPQEFLSDFGVRSMSAEYREPTSVDTPTRPTTIQYVPGESDSPLFGGNSNWRGPIWFPINALLVDAIRMYGEGAGRDMTVEMPTGSGRRVPLGDVADALSTRLCALFRVDPATGRAPSTPRDQPSDPLWTQHPTFSEYFHGDSGAGLGASHQTGWTAIVAHLICSPSKASL